jgi:hypothetical protein
MRQIHACIVPLARQRLSLVASLHRIHGSSSKVNYNFTDSNFDATGDQQGDQGQGQAYNNPSWGDGGVDGFSESHLPETFGCDEQ